MMAMFAKWAQQSNSAIELVKRHSSTYKQSNAVQWTAGRAMLPGCVRQMIKAGQGRTR